VTDKDIDRYAAALDAALESKANRSSVFVIHGRNHAAKNAVEAYLRVLGLEPVEFETVAADLASKGSIRDIVRAGMERAHGLIALFTPDEYSCLRPEYGTENRWQARPNVIFEAGMAYALYPERTIMAVLGEAELFSDLQGVHYVALNNRRRGALRTKLIGIKCEVNKDTDAWNDPERAGDFDACLPEEVEASSPFERGPSREDGKGKAKADRSDEPAETVEIKAVTTNVGFTGSVQKREHSGSEGRPAERAYRRVERLLSGVKREHDEIHARTARNLLMTFTHQAEVFRPVDKLSDLICELLMNAGILDRHKGHLGQPPGYHLSEKEKWRVVVPMWVEMTKRRNLDKLLVVGTATPSSDPSEDP